MNTKSSNAATGFLLLGVVFWGVSFTLVKESMAFIDVYSFLCLRFGLATVVLMVAAAPRFRRYTFDIFAKSVLAGLVLAASFILQTTAIRYTTASNAAFITGLCVVFVPALAFVLDRKAPRPLQVFAILLAVTGLALLTLKSNLAVSRGDLWAVACAVGFGVHILLISRLVNRCDAMLVSVTQLAVVALTAGGMGLVFNKGITIPSQTVVWRALVFLAVFSSAYMYTAQARFQKRISEIKAVMIYTFEPLFAAIFAFILIGERLSTRAMVGGVMIFIAMILSDFKVSSRKIIL